MSAWYLEPRGAFFCLMPSVNQMKVCAEVPNLTLLTLLCMQLECCISGFSLCCLTHSLSWWGDITGKLYVRKLVHNKAGHARFCPISVEMEKERKTGWRWRILWYSVSLVHPGRYNCKKSKTIYQYPLSPLFSFRPQSCKEKMWRAMHDLCYKSTHDLSSSRDFFFKGCLCEGFYSVQL